MLEIRVRDTERGGHTARYRFEGESAAGLLRCLRDVMPSDSLADELITHLRGAAKAAANRSRPDPKRSRGR